jgi:hypothetical protein
MVKDIVLKSYPECEYIQQQTFCRKAIIKNINMSKTKKNRTNDKMISMPVVNPHAAGIDIGGTSHFVCVSQDNVKEYSVFTVDLHEIAKHLLSYGVKTVALEST